MTTPGTSGFTASETKAWSTWLSIGSLSPSDFVTREEFEAVREMALIAREENDKLAARLAALEEKLGKA